MEVKIDDIHTLELIPESDADYAILDNFEHKNMWVTAIDTTEETRESAFIHLDDCSDEEL